MRNVKRHRSRICGRLTAWIAILALAAQAALPSMMAAARAGTGVSAGAVELVICTPDGLKRIALADRNPDPSVPSTEILCPICLAAQSPAVEPPPARGGRDLHVVPVAFDGGKTTLRPACGSAEPPPARAPPTLA